jgi:hypothetical protein
MDTFADFLENLYHYIKPAKRNAVVKETRPVQHLIVERLIDAGDDRTKPVYVGVVGKETHQIIRIGRYPAPVHQLKSFVRADGELKYTFENDITLTMKKSEDSKIAYTLTTPAFTQQSVMHVQYKTISMASEELDAIAELE